MQEIKDIVKFEKEFNRLVGKVMGALESTNNLALKKKVKKAMFDFSDNVQNKSNEKREQINGKKQLNNL